MNPVSFPQANIVYGPPEGLDESQVMKIPAWRGTLLGGNLDGETFVVVAWKPDAEDLRRLAAGGCVYLTQMYGLSPHSLATEFPINIENATQQQ